MRFVGPEGATFALLQIVPDEGELLYSPDGAKFYPLEFVSKRGEYFSTHTRVDYEVHLASSDGDSRPESDILLLRDGIMRCNGVDYRIDHEHRSIDDQAIVRP